jgi:hypothetical protein
MFVCLAAYCDDPRAFAGASLGGVAAGVLSSALVTRWHPISYATAQAVEGGAVWGTFTSLYLWMLAPRHHDERTLFGALAAGELLGAGLGGLVARGLHPSAGAVGFANSGALWLSTMTTLITFSIDPNLGDDSQTRSFGAGLLASELIGLGAGAVIGQRFDASRGQVWLSDVGAGLVGGTLPLLAWLIRGSSVTATEIFATAAAGTALGFAGAYTLVELLPRRRRAAAERAAKLLDRLQLAMMPVRQGGGFSLSTRLP